MKKLAITLVLGISIGWFWEDTISDLVKRVGWGKN